MINNLKQVAVTVSAIYQTVTVFISPTTGRKEKDKVLNTSGYATWFTAGGAVRIAHYDVTDDVITRKLENYKR